MSTRYKIRSQEGTDRSRSTQEGSNNDVLVILSFLITILETPSIHIAKETVRLKYSIASIIKHQSPSSLDCIVLLHIISPAWVPIALCPFCPSPSTLFPVSSLPSFYSCPLNLLFFCLSFSIPPLEFFSCHLESFFFCPSFIHPTIIKSVQLLKASNY